MTKLNISKDLEKELETCFTDFKKAMEEGLSSMQEEVNAKERNKMARNNLMIKWEALREMKQQILQDIERK